MADPVITPCYVALQLIIRVDCSRTEESAKAKTASYITIQLFSD
jgi:hypothetical protein